MLLGAVWLGVNMANILLHCVAASSSMGHTVVLSGSVAAGAIQYSWLRQASCQAGRYREG